MDLKSPLSPARDENGGTDENEGESDPITQRLQRCQQQSAGTILDLSHLELSELPEVVATMFPRLRHLNLRGNVLTTLPAAFTRHFPHLVTLNLSDNQLTSLPTENWNQMRHLQKLIVTNNQLATLPSSLNGLHALEELHLASNHLLSLDESLGSTFLNLHTLDLAHNLSLVAIPQSWASLPQLRVVDLSGNTALTTVPDKIRRLHERNVILHSRSKRRELITRALRIREAVSIHRLKLDTNPSKAAVPIDTSNEDGIVLSSPSKRGSSLNRRTHHGASPSKKSRAVSVASLS